MNRLQNESSPYLKQHAQNPVDWHPWGEEALEKARIEDKPIFLSIGYSACHWCHVMAHESFEDAGTAEYLNEHFVSVKVDREERPDLDALYMRSVTLMTGSGGWPLTVFLTPRLKPFYGGTYFPPQARYGMPSFRQVLEMLARAFREQRQEVESFSEQALSAVSSTFRPGPSSRSPGPGWARAAREAILGRFDGEHGGFGRGPKFPQPALLGFLLDEDLRHPGLGLRGKVLFTLRAMEAGGVRDQVGGGFHRYSVDGEWRVPHFEKMLYDNAQLASLYFRASGLASGEDLGRVGEEILEEMEETMAAPGGGFAAALDADSEGEEGKFYLWSPEEIRAVLGEESGPLLSLYGLQGGPGLEGGILRRRTGWAEAAAGAGVDEGAFRARVAGWLGSLRRARAERPAPGVDTKVLTDWNALAATAFLDGFLAVGRADFAAAGLGTLDAIWRRCWDGEVLRHVWDGGRAKVGGFLADYAYLARAELRAYEVSGDGAHLEKVGLLVEGALARFRDEEGAVFDSPASGPEGGLVLPVRGDEDGVLPSPLAVLADVLWIWHRLTLSPESGLALDGLLRSEAGALAAQPGAAPLMAGLAAAMAHPSVEVVVAAPGPGRDSEALLAAARRAPIAGRLVLPLYGIEPGQAEFPLFQGRRASSGAVAYVCAGGTCRPPVAAVNDLERILAAIAGDVTPAG